MALNPFSLYTYTNFFHFGTKDRIWRLVYFLPVHGDLDFLIQLENNQAIHQVTAK